MNIKFIRHPSAIIAQNSPSCFVRLDKAGKPKGGKEIGK
jgi:hypothetical protein